MTTRTVLVILAVTHMKIGVCIAGVRLDAPATWVRPVREFGSILLGDITYPAVLASGGTVSGQRRVMRPLDVVEFGLGHARPAPLHIEDWTCDFAHQRPRLLGGAWRVWLALGTSRALDGRNWPLVVGVHTLPDYEADVDHIHP